MFCRKKCVSLQPETEKEHVMRTATTPTTAYSTITLSMPQSDAAFARAIAKRMGWTIERKKKTAKPRLYDPETGETYGALTACNNPEMAERCKVRNARKCVWCIKASADFNSTAATSLRSSLKNGEINLLVDSHDALEITKKIPSYSNLSEKEQTDILMPYVQTSLLVTEAINLDHELVNNTVRLKERSGMRKDRYSSMLYNNYVVQILNTQLKPQTSNAKQILDLMYMRKGKIKK